jgi:hypothetical protein
MMPLLALQQRRRRRSCCSIGTLALASSSASSADDAGSLSMEQQAAGGYGYEGGLVLTATPQARLNSTAPCNHRYADLLANDPSNKKIIITSEIGYDKRKDTHTASSRKPTK